MKNIVVVGSQWGDEGKGKIVDWLSEQADVVIRFQGGHNAGHTLVIDGITYKLPEPFFVIATQNPMDASGTSSLPDSQLDRFLIWSKTSYLFHCLEKTCRQYL